MKNKVFEIPLSLRPPVIENIRDCVNRYNKRAIKAGVYGRLPAQGPDARLLCVKPVNDWMKQEYGKPPLRKLLGDFGMKGNCAFYLPIPTWANLFLRCKLETAWHRAIALAP